MEIGFKGTLRGSLERKEDKCRQTLWWRLDFVQGVTTEKNI
jgi:hypothetical protein